MTHFLQAGPVSVRYDAGFLRYLTLDGGEVVRMVYMALRDDRWQTAILHITDEVIEPTADSFRIQYQWQTNDLGIQMAGRVTLVGAADGSISFDFYGQALSAFATNRVGICVLHPLDGVTGQPCQVESPDGRRTDGCFPDYISPYQPFLNIQTLRWTTVSGQALQLDFSGDVFEMEDQRNWTDASFKTYSTPLSRPFPITLQTGDTVRQRVVFSLGPNGQPAKTGADADSQLLTDVPTVRPQIGLGQRADGQPLSPVEADRLRMLPLSHLRADVVFAGTDWQPRLANALTDARTLGVSLELALFFSDHPADEMTRLIDFMAGPNAEFKPVAISSVLVFNADTLISSDDLLRELVPILRLNWPIALIGGGTDGSFVDINRNPFDYNLVDFVVYSITPQVHAFDDLTLLDNIAGQAPTVQTARRLTGGKPVHISPVTLLPRYPPVVESATQRQSPPADPRQATDFGADWTRRSLAALTQAGVASVTFYETHGPRGLIDGAFVFPLFNALANPS